MPRLVELAPLQRAAEMAAHRLEPAAERRLVALDHRDLRPASSAAAAIPAPIVPPPITPTAAVGSGTTPSSSGSARDRPLGRAEIVLRRRHQKNACSPVCARPRISACTSCVPS